MKTLIPIVVAGVCLVGCSPPNPDAYVEKETPAAAPNAGGGLSIPDEPEPVVTAPAPAPAPGKDGPPDWDARGKELMAEHIPGFRKPDPASITEVTLSSGSVTRGKVLALTEDSITLELPQGEITYKNTNLAPATRVKLFARDYAYMKAKTQVDQERAAYRVKQREEQIAREKASGSSVPRNAADGSVWQVLEYLKETLRNPEHFRPLEWGRVRRDRNGYVVTLKYQTTGGSLGVITEHKYFFMDPTGKVVKVAAMKGGS